MKYHASDTWHDTTPSHIILTLGQQFPRADTLQIELTGQVMAVKVSKKKPNYILWILETVSRIRVGIDERNSFPLIVQSLWYVAFSRRTVIEFTNKGDKGPSTIPL